MSEIVDRLHELVAEPPRTPSGRKPVMTIDQDEAADLLDLISQLSDGTLGD
jgi:hypothetical protein